MDTPTAPPARTDYPWGALRNDLARLARFTDPATDLWVAGLVQKGLAAVVLCPPSRDRSLDEASVLPSATCRYHAPPAGDHATVTALLRAWLRSLEALLEDLSVEEERPGHTACVRACVREATDRVDSLAFALAVVEHCAACGVPVGPTGPAQALLCRC